MTTLDTLLAGICDDPDDDVVRLAYADCLEEQGRPEQLDRAEFIRTQIALSRMADDDPARPGLMVREKLLLMQYRTAWEAELAEFVPGASISFARGFPAGISLDTEAFLRHGAAIVARAPITALTVTGGSLIDLHYATALPRVRSLNLGLHYFDRDLEGLLADSGLQRVRQLVLMLNVVDRQIPQILARVDLPALEDLQLLAIPSGHSSVRDCSVEALVQGKWLPRLTSLRLNSPHLTPAGLEVLLAALESGRIEHLDLSRGTSSISRQVEMGQICHVRCTGERANALHSDSAFGQGQPAQPTKIG